MKTVLHAIDTWGPGGAETVCVELAAGLNPAHYRSSAAAVSEGWVHDALLARGVDTAITRTGRGGFDAKYLRGLLALARRQRADIIQSHLTTANVYGSAAARLLGIPSVATFHGMVDVDPGDRWAGIKMRMLRSNASRLVFVSESLRRHFCERYVVPPHISTVIHNGVDAGYFRPARSGALRRELGFAEGATVVVAVGNVRPAKGYDDLMRVAERLRDTAPHVRFVIVGERTDPLYSQLLQRRAELRLDDRVHFVGFRDDVAGVLNGADIYLNTSTSEGFSLTTIQAMACGLPVIATRSGGPEEIVRDHADGRLVPVSDAPAAARVLEHLVADSEERTRLGVAGRNTVLERFTLGRMIRAYEDTYASVLGSH